MLTDVKTHYDMLIDEGNDPVNDPLPLREYMNKWDGECFIEEMKLTKDKTVLEIGIGTGRLALKVAPQCKTLYGIDISPKTIKRAKENLKNFKNVALICDDFLAYDFNEKFNIKIYKFIRINNYTSIRNRIRICFCNQKVIFKNYPYRTVFHQQYTSSTCTKRI